LKILVTGSGGFLGGSIARHVFAHGIDVTGVARKVLPDAPIITLVGDLRDRNWTSTLAGAKWTCIVHCAAAIPYDFFGAEAIAAAEANTVIDSNVIDLALRSGARLIYLSGTSLYGQNTANELLDESALLEPTGPYLEAKAKAEMEILRQLDGRAIILRISAPYGFGQRPTVFSRFIGDALAANPILLFGRGTRTQSFTHVDDICNVFSRSTFVSGADGVFNIAGDPAITMHDLAAKIKLLLNSNSDICYLNTPDPQEYFRGSYSTKKAESILRWRQRTPLDRGIIKFARMMSMR